MFNAGCCRRWRAKTGYGFRSTANLSGLVLVIIVAVLTVAIPSSRAFAQISDATAFTPSAWQSDAEPARAGSRSRTARRAPAVTSTTSLEDFDVPRRTVRRAQRSSTVVRVVTKRPQQRRVKVAALGNTASLGTATPRKPVKKAARPVRVAALGPVVPAVRAPSTSLTGGGITWRASSSCLAGNLRSVLASLSVSYGSVTVNSTCRSARHNRRVGGARKSWHLTGNAADFRVHGANIRSVFAYLRSIVGGLKHYGGGRFHIDNGPRRTF